MLDWLTHFQGLTHLLHLEDRPMLAMAVTTIVEIGVAGVVGGLFALLGIKSSDD